jgi:hypothetical protein
MNEKRILINYERNIHKICDNIKMEYNIVTCPHCLGDILIFNNEICCAIFRHGIYKSNHSQLSPHASKNECDYAYENGLIYGCGKPFQVKYNEDNILIAEKCDYI